MDTSQNTVRLNIKHRMSLALLNSSQSCIVWNIIKKSNILGNKMASVVLVTVSHKPSRRRLRHLVEGTCKMPSVAEKQHCTFPLIQLPK